MKILIVQTAFIGDVVLATPLIEAAKRHYPGAEIDFVTIPYSAPILINHPHLRKVIVLNKRGKGGLRHTWQVVKSLKAEGYDLALVPHRSLRSAVMVYLAGIEERIGFNRSTGRFLLTREVVYRKEWHEVRRNLSLLRMEGESIAPAIYPGEREDEKVSSLLEKFGIGGGFIAIAPGSIWDTKRWPEEHYQRLCLLLKERGYPPVVLVGSGQEAEICQRVAEGGEGHSFVSAGELDPLESGALLKRAKLLVANDSAAGHLASAVGTKVISIFGPTVPALGFAPWGEGHIIVEYPGLYCRPCRIHGSRKCPEGHFRCMKEIEAEVVLEKIGQI